MPRTEAALATKKEGAKLGNPRVLETAVKLREVMRADADRLVANGGSSTGSAPPVSPAVPGLPRRPTAASRPAVGMPTSVRNIVVRLCNMRRCTI
ncbi:MAG: hypothetical protein J2P48_03805 [Alphaproteobacteria bacterium]|nr:hypothetical protein [Alphaproteobacteria bacterium]